MTSSCTENNQTEINSTTSERVFLINNEDFIFETVGGGAVTRFRGVNCFFSFSIEMQLSQEIIFSNPGDK